MRVYKQGFEQAVGAFVSDYHTVIWEARQNLGGLFRREDYPNAAEIRNKFDFKTAISPVPTAEDFRVSLAREEVSTIQKKMQERLMQSHSAATHDLWQHLYEVVSLMVERLSDPEAIFRDTLVTNIARLTEILPRLNLNDDPGLEAMRRKIQENLCSYSPDHLRKDKQARTQAARDAQSVMDSMAGYLIVEAAA